MRPVAAATVAAAFVVGPSPAGTCVGAVRADDRVTIRGNYYREESTRVLQPLVTYTKSLPDDRFTIGTEYLLDAITSASIGAGALQLGGDRLFTELRHEASLFAATRRRDLTLGGFLRYSTETDYESRALGLNIAHDFRQRTITLGASWAYANDAIYRIAMPGRRLPWTSLVPDGTGTNLVAGDSNLRHTHTSSVSYSHVLHPVVVANVTFEAQFADGPQENPYRVVRDGQPEVHPLLRRRFAPSGELDIGIPRARMAFQPRYRFYVDDWGIVAHQAEFRVHVRPAKHVRLRLRYRYYVQGGAFFFDPDAFYLTTDRYRTADPKMAPFWSHTPGIEVVWHLDGISRLRGMHWLEGAWLSATYNHMLPSPSYRFGPARIGSLAASFAF